MNLTGRKPVGTPKQIEAQIQSHSVKHSDGAPLSYRLKCNADGGKLQFENEEDTYLTAKGKPFSFCPIAYRAFHNRKFGREKAGVWVEVYFLNEKAQTCMLMFNNASAEQFLNVAKILFYDELSVSDVRFNCELKIKNNAEVKTDYFVCTFSFDELPNEEKALNQLAIEQLPPLYRRDTLDKMDAVISAYNYPKRFLDMLNVYSLPMENSEYAFETEFEEIPSEATQIEAIPSNTKAMLNQGKRR